MMVGEFRPYPETRDTLTCYKDDKCKGGHIYKNVKGATFIKRRWGNIYASTHALTSKNITYAA